MASKLYDYTPIELQKILDESNSYRDVFLKLGMSDQGNNDQTLRKVIKEYNLDLTTFNENRNKQKKINLANLNRARGKSLNEIFCKNSTYNSGNHLKNKLFKAGLKGHKCERCGLIEWQGQPIPLQLHHKDGDHYNNELENLELLCPNCHALTDTFAGKNKNRTLNQIQTKTSVDTASEKKEETEYNKIEKKYLLQLIEEYHNYEYIGNLLGVSRDVVQWWHVYYVNKENQKCNDIRLIASEVAPSRDILKQQIRTMSFADIKRKHNVVDSTIRKWCEIYKLPSRVRDIKLISDEDWETI